MKKQPITISELLGTGRDHAVRRTYIQNLLGISERQFQLELNYERTECDAGILSDNHGSYYHADNTTEEGRQEIVENVRRLESMGVSTLKTAASLKKMLSDVNGQEEMKFDDAEEGSRDDRPTEN